MDAITAAGIVDKLVAKLPEEKQKLVEKNKSLLAGMVASFAEKDPLAARLSLMSLYADIVKNLELAKHEVKPEEVN